MKKYVLPEIRFTRIDTEEIMFVTVSSELDIASTYDEEKMGKLGWGDFSNSN